MLVEGGIYQHDANRVHLKRVSEGKYILIDIHEGECIDVQKARNTKARLEACFFWYEPSLARFYTGLSRPNTNKRAKLGQETKHDELA